jgi:quercetin dioxygenase-like cupin family protein
MKLTIFFLLLLTALSASAADQDVAVPISQEPHHHLLLENQYTRVYDLTLAPRESTLMFRHDHDYVAVILTPAEVQNAVLDKPVTTGRAGLGEVRFVSAPVTHRLTNMSDKPLRNLTLEILQGKPPQASEAKPERGLDVGHGGMSDTVVDNREVRVQEVQIAPGGMLHKHTHRFPFLVVALSDLDLHNMPQGKPATTVHRKAGEVRWVGPGSTHEVMNAGKQEAHFVEVEFK